MSTPCYFKRIIELNLKKVDIFQELESDTGGVVWDSALVTAFYIERSSKLWNGKKTLELGAGTGVCSIIAATCGAEVVATDLEPRLHLIQKNVCVNEKTIQLGGGKVTVKELDWSKPYSENDVYDEIFIIDLVYYIQGVYNLVETLRRIRCNRILCAYEIRDIGEPEKAQKLFMDLMLSTYIVKEISKDDLDPIQKMHDPTSSANTDKATVKKISLHWTVDFNISKVFGSAALDIEVLDNTDVLVLDSRGLEIKSVKIDGKLVKYSIEDVVVLGEKIIVDVGQRKAGDKFVVVFEYQTGEGSKCTALLFLKDLQTADKKGPYLYSQCEAIHARSLIPCMDTPSVKQTYEAEVSVPKGLTCLMSALGTGSTESEDCVTFKFIQRIPIPSYLFAIIVGVLEKRDISKRCSVWSEPSLVEKALYEFADAEKILTTAEEMFGPYVWDRCDLVLLPPSFPFGGMENPCLIFVTPTVLTGDRSMATVITHEVAHSWTGNLVTNATWEHFWLNEGFTVFLERKIIGRMEGEEMRQFDAQSGWEDDLIPNMKEQFGMDHPFTKLCPPLQGHDPDDAYSIIPYEKGSGFLMYIEQKLGCNERFERFLKDYINKFAYKSIVTSDCKGFLYQYFNDKTDILDSINWDEWLHGTGIPTVRPHFDNKLMKSARDLAAKWINARNSDLFEFKASDFKNLTPKQQIKVLDHIRAATPIDHEKLEKMGSLYDLFNHHNCEILCSWIEIGINSYWKKILPLALDFVTRQGRLKFVRPIYSKLFSWDASAGQAICTFQKNAPFMHPITAAVVSKLIPK
uniref:Leuk-A4-hydro_C domain-containing protein n=1 Tax=Syphacia muris TaxID=451379 RepID=A0A0N5ASU4_9BILA